MFVDFKFSVNSRIMKVLKFGGTSVGSAENIQKVKEILMGQDDDVIVVVSALGGITDKILSAAKMAAIGTGYFQAELTEINTRHYQTIEKLFVAEKQEEVKAKTAVLLEELERIIQGVSLIGELTPKTLDKIGGFGERLSSLIISEFIPESKWFDSSKLIKTNSDFGKAIVDFGQTNQLIQAAFASFSGIAIVPGFISSNNAGEYTTLGRGGSDYTGAILAAAMEVASLEIWTDVGWVAVGIGVAVLVVSFRPLLFATADAAGLRDRTALIEELSTPLAQARKTLEECGELLEACATGDRAAMADAYGDILVTIIMGCATADLDLTLCLEGAYNEIKNRKGFLRPDGVFVKQS